MATQVQLGLSIETAISALAFASIGMIITPGGIGAYAFFLAKVLEQHGVPFEIGFANGTMQWFAQFLIIIFVGFISLGLLPYYNKKINMKRPEVIPSKIYTREELLKQVARWRFMNKSISFTNGCFDILHAGHISSLSEAAKEADIFDCWCKYRCKHQKIKR